MITFIARRILISIVLLWGVATLVFVGVRLIPGDPVSLMLTRPGETPNAAAIAKMRHDLGLDESIPVQYWHYLGQLLHLDVGHSLATGQSVWQQILVRWPYTVILALSALVLSMIVGLIFGVLSAVFHRSKFGVVTSVLTIVGVSIPEFWLGTTLALVFGVDLRLLPVGGTGDWTHAVLPVITLSIGLMSVQTRLIRAAMVDVLRADYIRTARAKGVHQVFILYKHALRNALIPVLTLLGPTVAGLLSGVFLIENVFGWPGIGSFAVSAVQNRDYPIIQGTSLFIAALLILGNLAVDISYAVLDPRIRLS